jgi:hypothetical protein
MKYIKGDYYAGLGTYIGTRKTHYPPQQNKSTINEHLFSTGEYDMNGAAILKRIKING